MKNKHQTKRTDLDQLRDLFKEFNNTYKQTFLIVTPLNTKNNENNTAN